MNRLIFNEKDIQDKKIISLQINLLNQCTSKCQSCMKHTWPKDKLDPNDVKNVIKWFANQGGQSIIFTGGDPILYEAFEDVASYASSLGIAWSIFSTFITNNKEKLKFIGENAYRIHTSIDAVEKDLYKEIRGVYGWDIANENIKYLQSLRNEKIPVRISSTISALNFDQCIKIYNWAKDNNLLLKFYLVQKWVNANDKCEESGICMSKENFDEFFRQLEEIAMDEKENKNRISNATQIIQEKYAFDTESHCKDCFISSINATINANGDIYPCCKCIDENGFYGDQIKYVYGNINNKTQEELTQEFNKRHNPNCYLMKDCFLRYGYDTIEELEMIVKNDRKPMFL